MALKPETRGLLYVAASASKDHRVARIMNRAEDGERDAKKLKHAALAQQAIACLTCDIKYGLGKNLLPFGISVS